MGFVEVAKEFRADLPESPIPLHQKHHNQVILAIEDFNNKLQEEAASSQVVDTTQGPNEKRALAYLDGFLSFPFINEIEKKKIMSAKLAIKNAKFQKLQREVNALKRNAKKDKIKPVDLLDAVIRIIDKYPIETEESSVTSIVTVKTFENLKPEIIISESYSYHNP